MTSPTNASAPADKGRGEATSDQVGAGSEIEFTSSDRFAQVVDAVECKMIGSMLGGPDTTVDNALAEVADDDPANGVVRVVLRVIRKLRSEKRSITTVIVAARLEREPDLPDALRRAPLSTLAELAAGALLPMLAPELARDTAQFARRRDLGTVVGRMLRLTNIAEQRQLREMADAAAAIIDRLESGVTI